VSATDYVLGSIQEESSEDPVVALCSRIHRLGQSFAHLHQQVGQVVEVQQVRQLNTQLREQADALAVREQQLQAKVHKQEDFRKKLEAKRAELKEIGARLEAEAERGRSNLLDQHDRIHSVQSDLRGTEQSHLLERESALHEERGWLKLEQAKLRRNLSDPDESDLSHLLH
jgi:regulator of replication initiation timing